MRLRLVSDLHWEMDKPGEEWVPPPLPSDSETVLILPGDLWYGDRSARIIDRFARRFRKVLLVLGNHDYWHFRLNDSPVSDGAAKKLVKALEALGLAGHVQVMDRSALELEGVLFVGASLWTDMNRQDWHVRSAAKNLMADFDHITVVDGPVYRKFTPQDWLARHELEVGYIKTVVELNRDKPIVVISHHAPCELSVDDYYAGQMSNHYFFTELGHWIADHPHIRLWCHGHMHRAKDYFINESRVVCNPRGYQSRGHGEDTNWDPALTIDL